MGAIPISPTSQGSVIQRLEYLSFKQGNVGSNPTASTNKQGHMAE